MSLTPDFDNLVLHSDASITDAVVFHAALRDIEASPQGMLYPKIHTYKEMPLGGGAIMPGVAFVNGWTFQLPAGNFEINGGNYTMPINPVAGCYIKQTSAAAYAVTAVGGGAVPPTAEENAAAVWQHATGAAMAVKLAETWGRLGLDPSKPLVTGDTSITFGDIAMALSEAGGAVTVARQ